MNLLWLAALGGSAVSAIAVPPLTFISIAGVEYGEGRPNEATRIPISSLTVNDVLDETPNTCSFMAVGFTPAIGQEVIIRLGAIAAPRFFAGQILNFQQIYLGEKPANVAYQVNAIDYTVGLNRRKVIKRYTAQSATSIVLDLMSSFTSGYTVVNVQASLPSIDEITFTNQDVTNALTNLAKRIGAYWFIDYYKDLHFFLTDASITNPTPLTPALKGWSEFKVSRDASQWVTRVLFEGGGVNALSDVAVGDTILPVEDDGWYQSSGGVAVAGPQRIAYTGVTGGAGGTLIGPGASPAAAPIPSAVAGAGLGNGLYRYAYTAVTGSGESLPSPLGNITLSAVGLPNAPSAAAVSGAGIEVGDYTYAMTFVTGSGETGKGNNSSSVSTSASTIPTPTTIGTHSISSNGAGTLGNRSYKYTFRRSSDGMETLPSPASNSVNGRDANGRFYVDLTGTFSGGPAMEAIPSGCTRQWYRTVAGGAVWKQVPAGSAYDNGAPPLGTVNFFIEDPAIDASLGANAPTADATLFCRVQLTNLPLGPQGTTGRKLYRWSPAQPTFKLVTTIGDNTTTGYLDSSPNASLGAAVPGSSTAAINQVALTGIAPGPSGTTARKVYRTVAAGSQLKLLTTIGDNTTTTFADSTADGSLGANAPTSDTSGLTQPTGQVLAGSTSVVVAGTAAFSSGGGWAVIGNGQQVIRYTGIAAGALTGVPASGLGAVTATVNYNSSITAVPALTGIPASGAGSIQYPILKGDPINLLVQVDDAAAQFALASKFGGDGVQEEYLQDRRVSFTEATARATAYLTLRKSSADTVRYVAQGAAATNTFSGRTISVALPAPTNVTGDFKIQEVTTTFAENVGSIRRVMASSSRFSLEDLFRRSMDALKVVA